MKYLTNFHNASILNAASAFLFSKKPFAVATLGLAVLLTACSPAQTTGNTDTQSNQANTPKPAQQTIEAKSITGVLHKDPNCGCCDGWRDHAFDADIALTTSKESDMTAIKNKLGVPKDMRSCHTAEINGFVFEGHIPAKYVKRFLANPPKNAIGLTVPGMPVGSPGMEMGDKFMPYKVMQINKDGSTSDFAKIESQQDQY